MQSIHFQTVISLLVLTQPIPSHLRLNWGMVSFASHQTTTSDEGIHHVLPKSAGSPPLTRLQNRACVFRFTRLLGYVALVTSTFDRFILDGLDIMTMSMKEL